MKYTVSKQRQPVHINIFHCPQEHRKTSAVSYTELAT